VFHDAIRNDNWVEGTDFFMLIAFASFLLMVFGFISGLIGAKSTYQKTGLRIGGLLAILLAMSFTGYELFKIASFSLNNLDPEAGIGWTLLMFVYHLLPGILMLLAWLLTALAKRKLRREADLSKATHS
jgi:hypothetical protein